MTRVRSVGLVLALVAAGCRPAGPPEFTAQQRAAVVDSVRALLDSVATWMSTQGAGRPFASFFDSSAAFVQAADGRIAAPSYDSLVTRTRDWTPPAGATLAWDTVRIEPLGPGMAHFTAAFAEHYTPPSGPAYLGHGVMSGVVVRRPAGWRIVATHSSVVPPAAGGR